MTNEQKQLLETWEKNAGAAYEFGYRIKVVPADTVKLLLEAQRARDAVMVDELSRPRPEHLDSAYCAGYEAACRDFKRQLNLSI